MKIFKFLAVALVAMLGFTACDKDCDHDFIEYDYSEALIGTWTFVEGGLAEAMVIKEDGSFAVTGVMAGGSLYESQGIMKVVNNKVTFTFDGDKEAYKGRLELVAGKSFSIVLNEEYDIRLTYDYCANDLADEIIGMWVCNDFPTDGEGDMMIETFYENGKSTLTGFLPLQGNYEQVQNESTDYKVIGDLLIIAIPAEKVGGENPVYVVNKLIYTPNATSAGDILTMKTLPQVGDEYVVATSSWLRVKESLNLADKTYDYYSAYVSNAKGKNEDFTIGENTFNMVNITARDFDKMFGSVLSSFEFTANSFTYKFHSNGVDVEFETPITVEDNKVTLNMGEVNPACRTVDMYMFQDADDSQLHIYMATNAFINYFANVEVMTLIAMGKIEQNDSAAIAKVFADMEARIESINVTFVLQARK